MTQRPVATRQSWARVDTAGPFENIAWIAAFSNDEFDRIRRGTIPEEMDDKWFSFFEEPNLFLLRSWTGYCIYRVTFVPNVVGAMVQTAAVSANTEQYRRSSGEYEAAFLEFLVHRLLLEEEWPMPKRPPESTGRRGIFRRVGERFTRFKQR